MRSFRLDPYLWIHLAGAAAVPIFLDLCLIGFAASDPVLPIGLEFFLVAAVGIVPVVWMQWQRPFYIFSLLVIALKPDQLTNEQRQLLRLFKTPTVRIFTVVSAALLTLILWQLYQAPPLSGDWVPPMLRWRLGGLIVVAIAFLLSNVFLQVPASVMRVLLASEAEITAAQAYPAEQIAKEFTVLGLRVNRILPEMVAESPPAPPAEAEPSTLDQQAMGAAIEQEVQPAQDTSEASSEDSNKFDDDDFDFDDDSELAEQSKSDIPVAETGPTDDRKSEAELTLSSEIQPEGTPAEAFTLEEPGVTEANQAPDNLKETTLEGSAESDLGEPVSAELNAAMDTDIEESSPEPAEADIESLGEPSVPDSEEPDPTEASQADATHDSTNQDKPNSIETSDWKDPESGP